LILEKTLQSTKKTKEKKKGPKTIFDFDDVDYDMTRIGGSNRKNKKSTTIKKGLKQLVDK
jgi:hypothetical protein